MKKKMFTLLLAGATAMMLFAGCGKNVDVDADANPTNVPTSEPIAEPTEEPTAEPTEEPTAEPTEEPTAEPTEEPTAEPTEEPIAEPTEEPTPEPAEPTPEPEVTLGQYKGLVLTSVSQEEVDAEIASTLEGYAELVEVDRAAENGDTVNINFVGTLDGVAFDGGTDDSEEGTNLVLGSGSFIDGFEDGLIGAVSGEVRELNLTFPEDYQNADLAGKETVFTVTVNSVMEAEAPELTDAFVSDNFGYATVEEYQKVIYDSLNKNSLYTQVTDAIMASSEVTNYPEGQVAEEKAMMVDYYTYYAEYYGSYFGVDTDTALQYFFGFDSVAALEAYAEEYAYDVIKNKLVLEEIAEVEELEMTDEKYQELALEYALSYGYADVASFEAAYNPEEIYDVVRMDFIMDYIISQAEITAAE